jgi:hypothetical protein
VTEHQQGISFPGVIGRTEPEFAFAGTIHQVVDVAGEPVTDDEAEVARTMAQQQ